MTTYDSTQDTLDHIEKVSKAIWEFSHAMASRADHHDDSKLQEPEKSLFDKYTPLLKATTYGSDEYKAYLEEMGIALQHHYEVNSHHPEHWPIPASEAIEQLKWDMNFVEHNPCFSDEVRTAILGYLKGILTRLESRVNGMDLLDLVEMFCDWYAASQRHAGGSLEKSLPINAERFEIAPQLVDIFENTRVNLGWK